MSSKIFNNTKINVEFDEDYQSRTNINSGENISSLFAKIRRFILDLKSVAFSGSYNDLSDKPNSLPANGGNADTVNNHTVESDVPADAVFTDTTYSTGTASTSGLTKLYSSTGTNTDGTMTQKAITEALSSGSSSNTDKSKLFDKVFMPNLIKPIIAYGNDTIVMCSPTDTITFNRSKLYISHDGKHWEEKPNPTGDYNMYNVVFGMGLFFLFAANQSGGNIMDSVSGIETKMYYSTDGENWTYFTYCSSAVNKEDIIFSDNRGLMFFTEGSNNILREIYYDTNNALKCTTINNLGKCDYCYINNNWIAYYNGKFYYRPVGIYNSWTEAVMPDNNIFTIKTNEYCIIEGKLKIPCNHYTNSNKSNAEIMFVSTEDGVNWNLEPFNPYFQKEYKLSEDNNKTFFVNNKYLIIGVHSINYTYYGEKFYIQPINNIFDNYVGNRYFEYIFTDKMAIIIPTRSSAGSNQLVDKTNTYLIPYYISNQNYIDFVNRTEEEEVE